MRDVYAMSHGKDLAVRQAIAERNNRGADAWSPSRAREALRRKAAARHPDSAYKLTEGLEAFGALDSEESFKTYQQYVRVDW